MGGEGVGGSTSASEVDEMRLRRHRDPGGAVISWKPDRAFEECSMVGGTRKVRELVAMLPHAESGDGGIERIFGGHGEIAHRWRKCGEVGAHVCDAGVRA